MCPKDTVPVIYPDENDLVVAPKSDITDGDFSALTGDGINELVEEVSNRLAVLASPAGLATRERHRVAIAQGISSLGLALDRLSTHPELAELIAEDIRSAVRALDSLVGRVGVDDVLDEIFQSFCIGK